MTGATQKVTELLATAVGALSGSERSGQGQAGGSVAGGREPVAERGRRPVPAGVGDHVLAPLTGRPDHGASRQGPSRIRSPSRPPRAAGSSPPRSSARAWPSSIRPSSASRSPPSAATSTTARPACSAVRWTVSVFPSGSVTCTSIGGDRSMERDSIRSLPSATWAVSAFSSRSGSFINQWAMRRSSSAWGPPPWCPRDHSQI